ncbi:MAG: hypothetical protein JGK31_09015 [Microcoleus sp. PH2017_30_WIL_O_A]|nr:hypothetical protein [Microcoleus sp. PH2017_30_WIL_O_A]
MPASHRVQFTFKFDANFGWVELHPVYPQNINFDRFFLGSRGELTSGRDFWYRKQLITRFDIYFFSSTSQYSRTPIQFCLVLHGQPPQQQLENDAAVEELRWVMLALAVARILAKKLTT